MQNKEAGVPVEILLVEDNPGDSDLIIEFLDEARVTNHVSVVRDGEEAMDFLRRRDRFAGAVRPDLILLDLNLPRKDGREVLAEIKADPLLASIPVVVLTSSSAEADIAKSYSLKANCYIIKPVDLNQFVGVVRSIESFWLTVVRLPTHGGGQHA
jgi:two-component system, chemotaxis family, response regulator Rcp1